MATTTGTGTVRRMIDELLAVRARGNQTIIQTTYTKLLLKGINPDRFNARTPDRPEDIARIRQFAAQMNISL